MFILNASFTVHHSSVIVHSAVDDSAEPVAVMRRALTHRGALSKITSLRIAAFFSPYDNPPQGTVETA